MASRRVVAAVRAAKAARGEGGLSATGALEEGDVHRLRLEMESLGDLVGQVFVRCVGPRTVKEQAAAAADPRARAPTTRTPLPFASTGSPFALIRTTWTITVPTFSVESAEVDYEHQYISINMITIT